MIIACPNCTKPYQLPDEQVAPLVQVQCAHCDYRVIYDFEAANDPSLREPDMLLADGFRSEADYDKALADGHSVTKHDLPAPPPKPVATRAPATTPPATAKTTQSAESPTPLQRPKSGGLVSGLGLSDTPGSLAAAVTEHDKTDKVETPEPSAPVETKAPESTVTKPEVEAPATLASPVESKPVESKPVESKPVESKPVESKPAEPATVKKPEPEAVVKPVEEEGKGSGPFWIILLVLVILIFVVTYVKTGQLNPALLLQPGK